MRLQGDHEPDCMVTALMHGGHEVHEYACTCLCLVRGCRCFGCVAKYESAVHIPYVPAQPGRRLRVVRKV